MARSKMVVEIVQECIHVAAFGVILPAIELAPIHWDLVHLHAIRLQQAVHLGSKQSSPQMQIVKVCTYESCLFV